MTKAKMNVEFSWKLYIMLLALVAVSFVTTWLLPVSEAFKGISAVPGVGALLMMLFQIWRDQLTYERQKELQRKQMIFNLSVTSHMANVAFDKHVQFCEKYIAQMHKGLIHLFREGPREDALSLASELLKIRGEFRTWMTDDITQKILPYEQALRKIGVRAGRLERLPVGEKRSKVVDEMSKIFSDVIGIKDNEDYVDETIATEKIITHLQQVLGIQELTKLRQKLIKDAIDSIS